ncbi:MAG TPA: hypothetical protein VGB52_03285 [Actinomycetota bacterium]
MGGRNRFLLVALVLASVGSFTGVAPARDAGVRDLSGRAAIAEQLRSLGVDPSTAVIQGSFLNYAGPNCPGEAWSCVEGVGPVVQISDGGINIFEAGGGSFHEDTCTVVQSNTTGPNNASCSLTTSTNGVTQIARITQDNGSGPNNAAVNMAATIAEAVEGGVVAAFDQLLEQEAAVFQENGSGPNTASIEQDLSMRAEATMVESGSSQQDSHAIAILQQDSDGGAQRGEVVQDHRLVSQFGSVIGNLQQEQQTRATDRNIVAFVNQGSGAGDNDLDLVQHQSMRMIADDVGGETTELQGNDAGGMIGDIQQDSVSGTSHYDADIDKLVIADPDADVVIQAEDPNCCDLLGLVPGTPTTCTIDMAVRVLGPDHAQQDAFLRGRAFAESACDVLLSLVLKAGKQAQEITEHRTGTFVDVVIDCEDSECSAGDRPPEPVGAAGNLHLALRNKFDGESFSRIDAQKPYFTDGDVGEIFEIKLEFHNHTTGPITNLVLSIPVPPGTAFAGCSGCRGRGPQGGVVIFDRGTVPPGGKVVGIFRVRPAEPGFFSVVGSFDSAQGGADSNPNWYLIG